jgi:hypothetical protein
VTVRAGDLVRIADHRHEAYGCFGRVVEPGESDSWHLTSEDVAVRLDAGSIVRVPAQGVKLLRSAA